MKRLLAALLALGLVGCPSPMPLPVPTPVPVPPPIPPPVPPRPPVVNIATWPAYLEIVDALRAGTPVTQAALEVTFGAPVPEPPAYVEVNPPRRYVVAYKLIALSGTEIRLHVYYDRPGGHVLKAEPG